MVWSGNSSVENCNVFGTTEGMFMVTRNKNKRENTHSLPHILRDILMALDELSPYHSFPRNYQDFIIRQVVRLPIASPSLLPPCGCRPSQPVAALSLPTRCHSIDASEDNSGGYIFVPGAITSGEDTTAFDVQRQLTIAHNIMGGWNAYNKK